MRRRNLLAGAAAWTVVAASRSAAQPKPDPLAVAWPAFKQRFILREGRLIDDANGSVSHSEGQGYAMLLAVAADDRMTFARLWGWTARELYIREDGLAGWRWTPGKTPHVGDPNNATDGDVLVAWALARAARRWDSPEYTAAGRRIALAIGRHATFTGRYGLMLRPGVDGFAAADRADGPVVNPSYWVFPAFPALSEIAPEIDWDGIGASGLALLGACRFGTTGLPCDWVSVKDEAKPAANFPSTFSYDAIRIPLYLVWAGLGQVAGLERYAALTEASGPPPIMNVQTGAIAGHFIDPGYRAVLALASCAHDASRTSDLLSGPVEINRYYPTALQMLALLAARDKVSACA